MIYIYGLVDPRCGSVRYIGQTVEPYKRLFGHLSSCSNHQRKLWIEELLAVRLKPFMIILDLVPDELCNSAERYWIYSYRESDLLNINPPLRGPKYTPYCSPEVTGKEMHLPKDVSEDELDAANSQYYREEAAQLLWDSIVRVHQRSFPACPGIIEDLKDLKELSASEITRESIAAHLLSKSVNVFDLLTTATDYERSLPFEVFGRLVLEAKCR